jgi:hypothetical protein
MSIVAQYPKTAATIVEMHTVEGLNPVDIAHRLQVEIEFVQQALSPRPWVNTINRAQLIEIQLAIRLGKSLESIAAAHSLPVFAVQHIKGRQEIHQRRRENRGARYGQTTTQE